MNKLKVASTIMKASERINHLERHNIEQYEKLCIHENYLRIINRLTDSRNDSCCGEDLFKKEMYMTATKLEAEHYRDEEKNPSDSENNVCSEGQSETIRNFKNKMDELGKHPKHEVD